MLVTGGFTDTATAQSSADLFDPATITFAPVTAQMTTPRAEHAATLLANGKVLITGGNDATGTSLASAEIYDPVANTFTATTHPMNSVRQAHHADLLPNGKVLITGGLDTANNSLASAEIYDPVADTFTLTGPMTTARGNHSSALLYTGQILVAGGLTGPTPGAGLVLTPTAELYNPATGTFTATGGNMTIARGHYAGIVLGDGTVFISGGATLPAGINADIYNPVTQTFSASGNFTAVQAGMREAIAPDGTVLLASGVNNAVPAITVPNSELFYPAPLPAGIVITTPLTLPAAQQNVPYTQVILEHGGVGQLRWVGDTLPPGLTLTSNGIVTGTPTQAGTFNLFVSAIDSSASQQSTTVEFTLQVNGPLTITTTTLPNAPTDGGSPAIPYSVQIQTTGGAGGATTFSVIAGALPPSITLNPATGVLSSGAVTDPATTYNFTIQAVSAGPPSTTATQAFTLTLVPFFTGGTPNNLPAGTEGVAYSQNITSTGGIVPYSYQPFSGTPPPGLSISTVNTTTGRVSGTPTSAGTFSFTFQATDSSVPPQGYTEQLTVIIRPQPASGLVASPQGVGIVTLTWTPSTSGDIASYNIHQGTASGVYTTVISAGNVNQYVEFGLTSGQQLFFVVTAVSATGVESVVSNEVTLSFLSDEVPSDGPRDSSQLV